MLDMNHTYCLKYIEREFISTILHLSLQLFVYFEILFFDYSRKLSTMTATISTFDVEWQIHGGRFAIAFIYFRPERISCMCDSNYTKSTTNQF